MMILRSKNFWAVVLLSGLYWGLAPFATSSVVFDIVNALSIAGCIGVMFMYYPSVASKLGWLWPFRNDLAGVHYFIIGVLGVLFYIASRHTWNVVWRWLDKPAWMQDHLFVGFMIWWTFMIAVMGLLSRDMEHGQIPKENWRWVGIFVTLGLALAGVFITVFDPFPDIVGGFMQ
jgi:hypothetical protein